MCYHRECAECKQVLSGVVRCESEAGYVRYCAGCVSLVLAFVSGVVLNVPGAEYYDMSGIVYCNDCVLEIAELERGDDPFIIGHF